MDECLEDRDFLSLKLLLLATKGYAGRLSNRISFHNTGVLMLETR